MGLQKLFYFNPQLTQYIHYHLQKLIPNSPINKWNKGESSNKFLKKRLNLKPLLNYRFQSQIHDLNHNVKIWMKHNEETALFNQILLAILSFFSFILYSTLFHHPYFLSILAILISFIFFLRLLALVTFIYYQIFIRFFHTQH